MSNKEKFSIVQALIDQPINKDGSYGGNGYTLIMELVKSFELDQLQEVYDKSDDFKSDIEKLILSRT